jgi:hypothetical protein
MLGAARARVTNMPRPTSSAVNTAMYDFFIEGVNLLRITLSPRCSQQRTEVKGDIWIPISSPNDGLQLRRRDQHSS